MENIDNIFENLETEYKEEVLQEEPKKRGRPRKNKKVEEENTEAKEFSNNIQGFASLGLEIIIKRLPNPVPLTEIEKTNFDIACNRIVLKYFDKIEKYNEEFALLTILSIILFPRLKKNKDE